MERGVIKPHSALPKGEEYLTGWVFAWLLEVSWCVARLCLVYKNQRGTKEGKALLHSKRAFPYYDEGVSLYQRSAFVN